MTLPGEFRILHFWVMSGDLGAVCVRQRRYFEYPSEGVFGHFGGSFALLQNGLEAWLCVLSGLRNSNSRSLRGFFQRF